VAAALALYVRAGVAPPASLVGRVTKGTVANKDVLSVLLTREWVTVSI
jgi:hypothetical protein